MSNITINNIGFSRSSYSIVLRCMSIINTHQQIDERSLALHRLIVDRVRRDPALLNKVKATLARWRTTASASSQPYLAEWEALLDQDMEICLARVVEDTQRAVALRQSSPFSGILTHQERFAFLKAWSRDHAT